MRRLGCGRRGGLQVSNDALKRGKRVTAVGGSYRSGGSRGRLLAVLLGAIVVRVVAVLPNGLVS